MNLHFVVYLIGDILSGTQCITSLGCRDFDLHEFVILA